MRWIHVLLVLYLLALALLARDRSRHSMADYLLAGRRLTLPALVATLVTTWYGGILGVGEYAWRHGVSTWVVFGLPYAIAAVLFGLVLAPRIRRTGAASIPEMLANTYGRAARFTGAGEIWLGTQPIAYVLMAGVLLKSVLAWPLWLCVVIATAVSMLYVSVSGLRAVVRTDILQMALMYGGFAMLLPFAVSAAGGLDAVWTGVPPSHRSWDGGLGWQAVLVWYLIALQTIVEPTFYQRILAARDGRTARNGVLVSVALWFLFDAMTVTCGLAARQLLPDLADPVQAFPALADAVLPAPLAAVFTVALLAIVMSTLDSYLFLSAATFGYDLCQDPGGDQSRVTRKVRLGLGLSAVISVAAALVFDSVVQIWHHVGTLLTSALLVPVVAVHLPRRFRPTGAGAVGAMIAGAGTSTVWLAAARPGGYPLGLEPMFPGLAAAAAAAVLLTSTRRRRSPPDASEERRPVR